MLSLFAEIQQRDVGVCAVSNHWVSCVGVIASSPHYQEHYACGDSLQQTEGSPTQRKRENINVPYDYSTMPSTGTQRTAAFTEKGMIYIGTTTIQILGDKLKYQDILYCVYIVYINKSINR